MRKKSDIELEGILDQLEGSFVLAFGKEMPSEAFEEILNKYYKELVEKFIMSRVNGLDPQSISFLLAKKAQAKYAKIEIDKKALEASKANDQNFRVILKNEKAKGIKKGKN